MPERLQRQRTRGWRLPPGARIVDGTTRSRLRRSPEILRSLKEEVRGISEGTDCPVAVATERSAVQAGCVVVVPTEPVGPAADTALGIEFLRELCATSALPFDSTFLCRWVAPPFPVAAADQFGAGATVRACPRSRRSVNVGYPMRPPLRWRYTRLLLLASYSGETGTTVAARFGGTPTLGRGANASRQSHPLVIDHAGPLGWPQGGTRLRALPGLGCLVEGRSQCCSDYKGCPCSHPSCGCGPSRVSRLPRRSRRQVEVLPCASRTSSACVGSPVPSSRSCTSTWGRTCRSVSQVHIPHIRRSGQARRHCIGDVCARFAVARQYRSTPR